LGSISKQSRQSRRHESLRQSLEHGSRKRGAFSWWISETLRTFCGQPFDEAAAFFTDLAFPLEETDADKIRNTRRPRTRAGRSKRQKLTGTLAG
jgi:hypothetical protein